MSRNKYRDSWLDDVEPKKINGNLGKVFWMTFWLSFFFGSIFTIGLFVVWNHFDTEDAATETIQEKDIDTAPLAKLTRQKIQLEDCGEEEEEEEGGDQGSARAVP